MREYQRSVLYKHYFPRNNAFAWGHLNHIRRCIVTFKKRCQNKVRQSSEWMPMDVKERKRCTSKVIALAVLSGMVMASGCSGNPGPGKTNSDSLVMSQFESNDEPSPTPTDAQHQDSDAKLAEIHYTSEQLDRISKLAAQAGLTKVYLPRMAVEGNPLADVELHENTLILHYKSMRLEQSGNARDDVEGMHIRQVELGNGATGEWLNGEDFAPKHRFFRFRMDGMHFFMDDYMYLPEEQVQSIAESLVELDELRS